MLSRRSYDIFSSEIMIWLIVSPVFITGATSLDTRLTFRWGGEFIMANKAELIENVASQTDLTKKQATAAVDAVFGSIQDTLAKGEKVQLIGFGNFEVRDRAARKGRNPQTGAEIQIPASKVPAFKPGKALKDAVK